MSDDNRKVDEAIERLAQRKGQTPEEVRKSFEAVLDKFCSDGEQGKAALKFLGFDERPSVDEFIVGLAKNDQLTKMLRKKAEDI